ncbi:hypothetical protein F2P79_014045 [Pimephales promelas]|nr:hypothetical protein F2P79_014045 [Pimephales promelas]
MLSGRAAASREGVRSFAPLLCELTARFGSVSVCDSLAEELWCSTDFKLLARSVWLHFYMCFTTGSVLFLLPQSWLALWTRLVEFGLARAREGALALCNASALFSAAPATDATHVSVSVRWRE